MASCSTNDHSFLSNNIVTAPTGVVCVTEATCLNDAKFLCKK